jgi:hypothetical protein
LQLQNCIDEGMLWILRVFSLFSYWWPYFVIYGFCRTIRTCICLLFCLWIFWLFVLTCRILKWVRKYQWLMRGLSWAHKCWSARGMLWAQKCWTLKGMFYPSSVGILTFARLIETCVESGFATVICMIHNNESFLLFWWERLGCVCISSSYLIQ